MTAAQKLVMDLVRMHGFVSPIEAGRALHPDPAVREGYGASTARRIAEQRLAAGLEVCEALAADGKLERRTLADDRDGVRHPQRVGYVQPGTEGEPCPF